MNRIDHFIEHALPQLLERQAQLTKVSHSSGEREPGAVAQGGARLSEVICKNCGLPIEKIIDPWGGEHGWHHPTIEREVTDENGYDVRVHATFCQNDQGEAEPETFRNPGQSLSDQEHARIDARRMDSLERRAGGE